MTEPTHRAVAIRKLQILLAQHHLGGLIGKKMSANLTTGNSYLIIVMISAETSVTEEPHEEKFHAGICAGGGAE